MKKGLIYAALLISATVAVAAISGVVIFRNDRGKEVLTKDEAAVHEVPEKLTSERYLIEMRRKGDS